MTRFINPLLLFVLLTGVTIQGQAQAQGLTQTIRGTIVDKDSKFPVIGANVVLLDSDPILGTVTDINGEYVLKEVPIGRQKLLFSFVGFKPQTSPSLIIVSGKEYSLNIELEENVTSLQELVIRADNEKVELNNEMAMVSARSFNLEETKRYAGSINDPSRMAANFAGVASANDGRNDIVIRGNSPSGLLWRLEGLDIPSPNHYSAAGTTGGPITMLNNNQLAKSDFITAAFPAEYGNAISGVFDLRLRNGNNTKHEFLGQIGFNGVELGAEGPLAKSGRSSYMVNYRYSTLAVASEAGFDFGTGAAIPKYQDLSFKVNLPQEKSKISIFGLWGISYIELLGSESDLESGDLFGNETTDIYNDTSLGLVGLSYTRFLNKNTFTSLVIGASQTLENTIIDSLAYDAQGGIASVNRQQNIDNSQRRYSSHLMLNKKADSRNTFITGIMVDVFDYNFYHDYRIPATSSFFINRDFDGPSLLTRGYANWKHKFNDKLTLSTGLYGQYYDLTESFGLDPRASLRFETSPTQSLSFGYGFNHQLQPLPFYFQEEIQGDGTSIATNRDLDFVRSHHLVLGYDHSISSDLRVKAEVYYQNISGAGVDPFPSSFSTINVGADFDIPDKNNLVNGGDAENIGIEFTLEKFFSEGYYFLLTNSLFSSTYRGSDGVLRSSAFDGNYILNILAGKEWTVGRRSNTISIDWKLTVAGGRYITPIDRAASLAAGREVRLEDRAFSQRLEDYFRTDLRIGYRMNRPKLTHEWAIDIQNVTNRMNDFLPVYNRRTGDVNMQTQIGLFPVPLYRIYF